MFKPPRGKKAGEWKSNKSFGPKKSWDRGSDHRNSGRSQMHPAICGECGDRCEVTFKPNGRKPVLCGRCYKREEGQSFREDRPSHGPMEQSDNRQLEKQLRTIQEKLDAILEALNA